MTSPEPILSPTFLFRFSATCHRCQPRKRGKTTSLGKKHVLPSFGEIEGRPLFADLRAGWTADGMSFSLRVAGKTQTAWCRGSRLDDSDGLQVWIDTRDTHNIHRASRFCHRFVLLPFGAGRHFDQPIGELLPINRARENPKPVADGMIEVHSEKRVDGYVLEAHIPATALTGYDPEDHPRLGFTYAVVDRELGWQTFSIGPEFPFQEDPSLWGTLELAE